MLGINQHLDIIIIGQKDFSLDQVLSGVEVSARLRLFTGNLQRKLASNMLERGSPSELQRLVQDPLKGRPVVGIVYRFFKGGRLVS